MTLASQIAKQFREVMLNSTWVATNFKAQLTNINWEMALTKADTLNTIATLTFQIDYYVAGLIQVVQGGSLDIRDKYSFDTPPIKSQKDC